MLTIRAQQMKVFQPAAEAAYLRNTVEFLRQQYAKVAVQLPGGLSLVEQLSEMDLRAMVADGIARARGYGMSSEVALSTFVVLMFVAAPNFDTHPLIQRVLKDEKFAPDARIDQLWVHTSEQNWEVVKQKYDAAAWRLNDEEEKK